MSSESDNRVDEVSVPIQVVNGATRVVGVFGYPIEHSRSPAMHNAAFRQLGLPYIYVPFSVHPDQLSTALFALQSLGVVGVNLTIPHKEAALGLVRHITREAAEVGAINTIHSTSDGLVGDNTDGFGFYAPLQSLWQPDSNSRAIILGAGGAARSVAFKLVSEGVHVTIANRSLDRAQKLADAIQQAGYRSVDAIALADRPAVAASIDSSELVVNSTRVGMYPEIGEIPEIPIDALRSGQMVYDLIYNPIQTRLLHEAESRGCRTLNGAKMLVYQGAAAFERWTGVWPPVDIMEEAVLKG